jgi:hypothetical protein
VGRADASRPIDLAASAGLPAAGRLERIFGPSAPHTEPATPALPSHRYLSDSCDSWGASLLPARQPGGPFRYPRLARLAKLPGNRTVACTFPEKTGNSVTKRRRNMPSHTLRRRQRPELQADRKNEPSSEAAIAAQLRALIPCSTDPAWLEKMAREVESKAHRR